MSAQVPEREVWHGGQLLAFSGMDGITDYRDGLVARTAGEAPGIDIVLPGRCRIRFSAPSRTRNVVAGDWFGVACDPAIRGVFLDAHHLLIEGPCEIDDLPPSLACTTHTGRALIGAAAHFDPARITADFATALAARRRWMEGLRLPPGLPEARRRTLCKALSVMKTQVCAPEGMICRRWTTPDRWPHRAMWLWDSAFHVIGWRHVDPALAREALLAVFDAQAPDGFVPHMATPADASEITQPPVLGLAAALIEDLAPKTGWIETVYPRLCAGLEWDLKHRDRDGDGLLEWAISTDPRCRSGESGMDNSPRFDGARRLAAVDFNSFLSLEAELLATFALAIGRKDEADRWNRTHMDLNQLIRERLWCETRGFFVDVDTERGMPSPVLAVSGFLPLLCGAATPAQAARLADSLQDHSLFGTAFPVPSVAGQEAWPDAGDMWRGPVWINFNWLIARGFARYGFDDVAAWLRAKTMEEIERTCESLGSVFEFYDARLKTQPPALPRKGACAPGKSPYHQVIHDYGWTATLYVDLVFEMAMRSR